ncbi:hypothetical protein VC83_01439 [Pseudogymnoascus destructans]|uniref:Uncharacterized protein n=1 Tax=Pseudogymnoascus destructans TaxID=655981 RepID=A0A177AJ96_9PEZI|nr:uncharacterized protein VC83_01439 [Pseudogymnoascus destructans]OAF62147.1 hypothetical protein VC83_01439 [Pseudogymnoascus destructans]
MVRVAVAGGTSGLGRLVVDAIVATKKHDVFVLSRKESDVFASKPNVKLFAVNYAVPATITAVLEKNRVGTVISCLHLNSKEASDVQLNLIEGVGKTVERFAPSKFGLDYLEVARVDFEFHAIEFKVIAVNKLKEFPSLTYTRFITGTFMDFFGPLPNLLINVASLIIKPRNRKAAILGDGSATIVCPQGTPFSWYRGRRGSLCLARGLPRGVSRGSEEGGSLGGVSGVLWWRGEGKGEEVWGSQLTPDLPCNWAELSAVCWQRQLILPLPTISVEGLFIDPNASGGVCDPPVTRIPRGRPRKERVQREDARHPRGRQARRDHGGLLPLGAVIAAVPDLVRTRCGTCGDVMVGAPDVRI